MAQGLLATRKRRIVGRREPLPEQGPRFRGLPGSVGVAHAAHGEPESGDPRYQDRDSAAVVEFGFGLVPPPARRVRSGLRASVFFGYGSPFSPCAGAALRSGLAGLPPGSFA